MENSTIIKITASMVKKARAGKEIELHKQFVQEAIRLINEASEKMLSELKNSVPIVKAGENFDFEKGLRTDEVRNALKDAGFFIMEAPLKGESFLWLVIA